MTRATMQDIADHLKISKNSVSRALRNKTGVSEKTRREVYDVAKLLGYLSPEQQLDILPSKEKHFLLFGTTFALSQTSFFGEIINSIEKRITQQNDSLTIIKVDNINQPVEDLDSLLPDKPISGIFILSHISKDYIQRLLDSKYPCVLIDHHDPNLKIDTVVTQNITGAQIAVNYLLERGHTKIGFIGDISFSPSYSERFLGYKNALQEAKIPLNDDLILSEIQENQYALYKKLDSIETMPTAWFCVNSGISFILNSYLHSKGYKVPENVSIMSFDNTEFSRMANPPITCIATDLIEMGISAVDLMHKRISRPDMPIHEFALLPEIIERNSIQIL